jgi:hypothetical protein
MKSKADLSLANGAVETLERLRSVPVQAAKAELDALYFKVRHTHVDQGAEQVEAERAINALRMALDQESISLRAAWDQAVDKTKAWRDWLIS